ncbi:acyl-CoA dehydrogenase family protein [Pedomonas sp. V897]|uniref:acyl-CoA dehydrogenase family protein n=1 Tax=Pedomonas sp. V897 TaxID=3446482 RepID=UPI003EE1FA8A
MNTMPVDMIDLSELRSTTQRLLADKIERRSPWIGNGRKTEELDRIAAEQGWFMLTAPEDLGGLGQSFVALAPIYEELGRSLAPIWLSGTMAAIDALLVDGSDAAREGVAGVLEGGTRIAFVMLPEGQSIGKASLPVVPADENATHFLVVTHDAREARLIPVGVTGLTVKPVETWDLGRGYVEVILDNVADGLVLSQDAAITARAHCELALALDCVGASQQCLDETVTYMLGRQQFGRPIASFQALKHRAADLKVAVELARSLANHAAQMFASRSGNWSLLATQARVLATDVFRQVAEDAVQLHGGVGFTWEFNCHLFLKRALMNELLHGTPEQLRDRIAAQITLDLPETGA